MGIKMETISNVVKKIAALCSIITLRSFTRVEFFLLKYIIIIIITNARKLKCSFISDIIEIKDF